MTKHESAWERGEHRLLLLSQLGTTAWVPRRLQVRKKRSLTFKWILEIKSMPLFKTRPYLPMRTSCFPKKHCMKCKSLLDPHCINTVLLSLILASLLDLSFVDWVHTHVTHMWILSKNSFYPSKVKFKFQTKQTTPLMLIWKQNTYLEGSHQHPYSSAHSLATRLCGSPSHLWKL